MKFPFVSASDGIIMMISSLSLCSFFALRIVAQLKKISCGFPAKVSKRTLKHAWRRQETPDSGLAENLIISMRFLQF
jgi:hypothetical protein